MSHEFDFVFWDIEALCLKELFDGEHRSASFQDFGYNSHHFILIALAARLRVLGLIEFSQINQLSHDILNIGRGVDRPRLGG